jgi:hypothetical protein
MCQKNTVHEFNSLCWGKTTENIYFFSLQSLTRQVHVTRVWYNQVKVKLSLSLMKHHAMKENVGVDVKAPCVPNLMKR